MCSLSFFLGSPPDLTGVMPTIGHWTVGIHLGTREVPAKNIAQEHATLPQVPALTLPPAFAKQLVRLGRRVQPVAQTNS